jgi:hypothetical protein
MANGLKTIDKAIQEVKESLIAPAGVAEDAHRKVLLNFLDGLRGQIKAFCFTWTGDSVFDDPTSKPR